MSQQINLFNPLFRKKGFSFASALAMVYGAGLVVVLSAVVALYQAQQLQQMQGQARIVDEAHKNATALTEKLTAEFASKKPNARLEAELAALDVKLQGRRDIVDALESGAVGNEEGFSSYMQAFSRQSVHGLWLTGFDIARAGNDLAIQGRTMSTDLVASYLKQLNQERALHGRQFAAMRISQPLPEPLSARGDQKPEKGAKDAQRAIPPYLDFTISTTDIVDAPLVKVGVAAQPLIGYVDSAAAVDALKSRVGQAGSQ